MDERDYDEYNRLIQGGSVRYGLLYSTQGYGSQNVLGTSKRYLEVGDSAGSGSSTKPFVYDGIQDRYIYNSYAGADIVASLMLPGHTPIILGELSTISYSIHRENVPVRVLGHVSPLGFTKGPRTIAGSMIFTVFNEYAFYRLQEWSAATAQGLYPLADMLPAFDIIITFTNEYGAASKMRIQGITIIDEGQTMSIEDMVTEQTYQYMARAITPMVRQKIYIADNNISGTGSAQPTQP